MKQKAATVPEEIKQLQFGSCICSDLTTGRDLTFPYDSDPCLTSFGLDTDVTGNLRRLSRVERLFIFQLKFAVFFYFGLTKSITHIYII